MIPKISVIVSIHNNEKEIEQCINSIISQTLKEIEILLIDNGSKDNSYKVCEILLKKDNRIILLKQEHKGVMATLKAGINHANGEFISFINPTDVIEKDMYEKLIEHFNLKNVIFDYNISNKLYITKIAKGLLEELDDKINDAEELVINSRYLQKLFDEHKKYEVEISKLEKHMKTIMCNSINEYVDSAISNRVPQFIIDTKELTNKKIAIYAAGLMGQDVYWQLDNLGYNIVIQVDKNYLNYQNIGRPIYPIDKLLETEYDIIVIAIIQEEIAMEVKENLINMGIKEEKMIWRKPLQIF